MGISNYNYNNRPTSTNNYQYPDSNPLDDNDIYKDNPYLQGPTINYDPYTNVESDAIVLEDSEDLDEGDTLVVKAPEVEKVVVKAESHFSELAGDKIKFKDFYQDARTFLEKANSTKFIVVAFTLILSPILLVYGHISPEVYRELVIIITLTYLGADVYERKAMIKERRR